MGVMFAGWLLAGALVTSQASDAPKPAVSNVMNAQFPAVTRTDG